MNGWGRNSNGDRAEMDGRPVVSLGEAKETFGRVGVEVVKGARSSKWGRSGVCRRCSRGIAVRHSAALRAGAHQRGISLISRSDGFVCLRTAACRPRRQLTILMQG